MQPTSEDPFFLVGALRSGTTVLRLLLGHHPQICRCDEFEYVASALEGHPDWPDVETYVRELSRHRDFRESGFHADSSLSFPELARDFLAQRRAADGRRLVGATVHNHFDQLPRIWPLARYIHLARDPRDVARSCVEMGWTGNAWSAVAIWEQAYGAWHHLQRLVPADCRMEVRFEDLVVDTEGQLARITRFLGIDYDPVMLEIELDTTYRRPDPHAARSWRQDTTELEVRVMEARLGARLAESGYAPSGFPPLEVGRWHRLGLSVDHRVGRMRFAQRRYGIPLWTASFLTRRLLRLEPLRQRAQQAIDRVDERYLR